MGLSELDSHRKRLRRQRKRGTDRRLLLERLEERQLLTTGPQLVGIQPNEGELLGSNQVRHIAPRELVFQFDDMANLDPATLDGIRITRSGFDGQFERAALTTDLGTQGQVVFNFTAAEPGETGNGVELFFTRSDHGGQSLPTVSVDGKRITVDLNTNFRNETTAGDLLQALNNHASVTPLLTAGIARGDIRTVVALTAPVGVPLTLSGANHANATSNFNAGQDLQIRFTATQTGQAGNGLIVQVTRVNRGGPAAPRVTVNDRTVGIELNSNVGNETTAQEVISAVNNSAAARALMSARLDFGDPQTRVGNRVVNFSPLVLTGANDVQIRPGHIDVAPNGREVIFRFAENLPDDKYRIEILGSGATALRNADGEPFNGGRNLSMDFRLDLAPRVEAVVPQPVTRNANGVLQQARNQIVVYFNHDHLAGDHVDPAKASNPAFYKLYLTQNTATTTDDTLLVPTSVAFDVNTETAVLTFSGDLAQLAGSGAAGATFRLRIGTDEDLPAVPVRLTPATDPGSSFETALDLGPDWNPAERPAQSIIISSEIANVNPFPLDFPGASDEPGHRNIPRIQDHVPGGADSEAGITTLFYNFPTEYVDTGGNVLLNAITPNQRQRAREIFELYGNYLGVQFIEGTDPRPDASPSLKIITGDLRAINPTIPTGVGAPYSLSDPATGQVILELQDFNQTGDDAYGGRWFRTAMTEIGRMLGFGPATELPGLQLANNDPDSALNLTPEPVFPGDQDIVHGQHLFRPISNDIDMYRFTLPESGELTIETFAERLATPSLLDTVVTLYRLRSDGTHELLARNDDYFSKDSYLELILEPGTYFVGVSASGNSQYDPAIEDSGLGGTTEGNYELRLNFRPSVNVGLTDSTGVALDGNGDGKPGGVFNFWFRTQLPANTLFVDKLAAPGGDGSLAAPFQRIETALAVARPHDIVRIVANGGDDGDLATVGDNRAYEIGFNRLGSPLADGPTFNVPRDVTVMVDAGAVFKMRRAMIGVGSTSVNVNASGGALQVLGTPRIIGADGQVVRDATGQIVSGSVHFTSLHDRTIGTGVNPDVNHPDALPGDWGGIWFRHDVDGGDRRFSWEDEGIFLNTVNYAKMSYGGGDVIVSGIAQPVSPVSMTDSRPTVTYNTIAHSAQAAMSANPNSFRETNFHTPQFQARGEFSADYNRVGPDIHFNRLANNSINGLFVRVRTPAGNVLQTMTVPGRFDDTDIVHVISENLVIQGSPGGPVAQAIAPPTQLVTLSPLGGGTLPVGTYNYVVTFADSTGNEGPASEVTQSITLAAGQTSVLLGQLPAVPAGSDFTERRIYRSRPDGQGPYTLVSIINPTRTTFIDDGVTMGGTLAPTAVDQLDLRARLSARLVIDPGTIVKLDGARIETTMGAQLIAEGQQGRQVVFTGLQDTRYGAGGTFRTSQASTQSAERGDWGGLMMGPLSHLSLDHAVIAYAGGVTRIEGTFAGINPVELHQATARITNSRFEQNGTGVGGQSPPARFGRGANAPGSIFVRGAQPVIVNNTFQHNDSSAININVNSLNHLLVSDLGRSTGFVALAGDFGDNRGPLVRLNRLVDNGGVDEQDNRLGVNGMVIRGGTLTTEGVWDDTDIAHVVLNETIVVPDFHTFGGLRLQSSPTESLVVKLEGDEAGFRATGRPLDINDRIGGMLHIVGQPRFPVVLTSLKDNTVGAGFQPDGRPQTNTGNTVFVDGPTLLPTEPQVDNGTLIDNNVPVDIVGHFNAQPGAGGRISVLDAASSSGVTTQGNTQLFVNADFIYEFINYIDVGSDGQAVDLATTTITMPPTLVAPDLVASEGTFAGPNGLVSWRAETRFDSGVATMFNTVTFTSADPLGNMRFVNYLDEDVIGAFGDLLWPVGTPGEADFRLVTLHDAERIGFSQGGFYSAGPELVNASWDGWAADEFPLLQTAITAVGGTTYTPDGNINLANLPPLMDPELGQVYGPADITTAMAYSLDPTATTATITTFLELVVADPARTIRGGDPGDWGTIELGLFSHDRNVAVITENEPRDVQAPGTNGTSDNAQYLGELAPDEKSGDETRRLGFIVNGHLSQPNDVDVYSFSGQAGTEVWLDIDRTLNSLDTIVELVDGNGQILALSNSSLQEERAGALTFVAPGIEAFPMRKSPLEFASQHAGGDVKDHWSTNPLDAGMRVVLPGALGSVGTYHVRVRSNNLGPNDPLSKLTNPTQAELLAGRTRGAYQLQVRLREQDEFAGSTIQYSDIRFATTAITISGQPMHSPLLGEIAESTNPNNTFAEAQNIGNLLVTDRAVLSIAGRLEPNPGTPSRSSDLDWYQFDITYEMLESIPGVTNVSQYFATMFDIDYADGLARANTNLHIYDADGNLILRATDSNVAEDRPGPLRGNDLTDLSRGSVGARDPMIGTVELPVGTYYVVVSNDSQMPAELDQFLVADPTNPLFRLEPINSLQRIVDERFETLGSGTRPTAVPPVVDRFIDLSVNAVPFHLGDVVLFVGVDNTPAGAGTQIVTVNPFTGARETIVGNFTADVRDIAMRHTGELFGFSTQLDTGVRSDAGTGNYLQIDTGTGAITNLGDDGISTFHADALGAPVASQDGIHFHAITYTVINGQEIGLAVGHRPPGLNDVNRPGVDALQNILYAFNPATGQAMGAVRAGAGVLVGPGTNIVPRGLLDTSVDTGAVASSGLKVFNATEVEPVTGETTRVLVDGLAFQLRDNFGGLHNFELNSGPEIQILHDPLTNNVIRDGDAFQLSPGGQFTFDTGSVIVVEATNGSQLRDGDTFTITDRGSPPRSHTFEFNNGPPFPAGSANIEVRFSGGMTRDQIVQSIVNAINDGGTGMTAIPLGNRITLLNESEFTGIVGTPLGIRIDGQPSGFLPNRIPIEETFTAAEVAAAIAAAAGSNSGAAGNRVNFGPPVQLGNFADLVARGVVLDHGTTGAVEPGRFPVNFLVSNTANEVAVRIANAINARGIPGITATANEGVVTLSGATVVAADSPLLPVGSAPGGLITGMAFLGDRLFAVTGQNPDNPLESGGGLYEIENYQSADAAQVRYVGESVDLVGINFQGLTAGPPNVEGGRYQDVLFGIDASGVLYAFDEFGTLLPAFVNAAGAGLPRGIPTTNLPAGRVNGLAFSNLDFNLWHETAREPADPQGHGVQEAFDASRLGQTGQPNRSLWFGFENFAANNVLNTPANQEPVNLANTYNFPGGAHGTIETNTFSLAGYSPADQPVLYFNYFLETEAASSTLLQQAMRDAARVFIGDDSGNWELLATNNSTRLPPTNPTLLSPLVEGLGSPFDVQELFDVGENGAPSSWRQVRIPLDAYAGRDNLRLRFDFSTAGTMNLGNIQTTGDELRAIPGNELRDGQRFTIDGNVQFEFDMGFTLVIPSGAAIPDGERLTVDGITFEFDRGNGVSGNAIPIPYDATQSASEIALNLQQILAANRPAVPTLTPVTLGAGREPNDTLATASDINITGNSMRVTVSGTIGDNAQLPAAALDVDMIRMDLDLNGEVTVDTTGSQLNTALRIFNDRGVELTPASVSPFRFVAPAAGTYFLGVSSAANRSYDPLRAGSGTPGLTGPYNLAITVNRQFASHRDANRLNLQGAESVTQQPAPPSATAAVAVNGSPGATTGNRVAVHAGMSADEVATAIRFALANRFANGHVEAIKGHNHVVRVIGRDVTNPGPLGLTSQLPGDEFGNFTSNTRGQNNAFEGFYIDDIIIGFAERGEMATRPPADDPDVTGITDFTSNPKRNVQDIEVGPYQLEIRGGTEYGRPFFDPVTNSTRLQLTQSFDTNDRLTQQHSLIALSADQLSDGQTFTLSDGVRQVVFEFDDLSLPVGHPQRGVASGNVRIAFNPRELDPVTGAHAPESADVIARRIRDAINSPQVQSLLDIRAALSDGTATGSGSGGFVTSDVRVNLFGNALITTTGTTLTADLVGSEPNNTLETAVVSGIVGGNSDIFRASGFIGDDPTLDIPSNDVDLIQFQLLAGERISIDIDAAEFGSLNSFLRVFDEFGFPLVNFTNDAAAAPGEVPSTDSYLVFTAPASGTFYVGVSSVGNEAYNPLTGSIPTDDVGLTSGPYTIEIRRLDLLANVGVQVHNAQGDENHHRDQGQLVIIGNRISHSAEFAIDVGPGVRVEPEDPDADPDLDPDPDPDPGRQGAHYPAPVRNTRELNTQRLAPGVTIVNNLLSDNASGIAFRGDAVDDLASVPFGRIVNNTIVGGTITAPILSQPEVFNDVIFPRGAQSFADAVVSYQPLFGGGPGPEVPFDDPTQALGVPDFVDDPLMPTGAVSLGRGGRLTLEFTNNTLTGSGDAAPDLFIFAAGAVHEEFFVEVSKDGVQFFAVGKASTTNGAIDLDAFGFGPNDHFRFVRITDDPNQGPATGPDVGAKIDAVGAISTFVPPNFRPGGQGILVADNAGPTILNNIIINHETGIDVDASSMATTVVGGTLYQHNTTNSTATFGLGAFAIDLGPAERVFVDPVNNNFYLAPGSRAIDSAIDSLQDRPALVTVKTPLGIPVSPILAPDIDLTGQLRVDDPSAESPAGIGERTFKDRGALDRSDFVGPSGLLVSPQDNDGAGLDKNPAVSIVELSSQVLTHFSIQLFDGLGPTDPHDGIGADDSTVRRNTVTIFRGTNEDNLEPLVEGIDYRFEYDATNNIIRLTPLAGIWEADRFYRIDLANEMRFVLAGRAGRNISDGETFHIADRFGNTQSFEFDRGFTLTLPPSIPLNGTVPPTNGNGEVDEISPINDGETFTIANGGQVITFEFDTDGFVSTLNRPIPFSPTDSIDTIADAVVSAILAANLGLAPRNLGGGEIHLGGTASHFVDVAGSTLTVTGEPGVASGAIPIPLTDVTISATEVAELMADAIAATPSLEGVSTMAIGTQVFLEGTAAVSGAGSVAVPSIKDLAGNPLKANRLDGTTQFDIFLGSGLDFGSAPDGPYPSKLINDGARHQIVDGFFLGSCVTVDVDGPGPDQAGSDGCDDGVNFQSNFNRGYDATFTVTVTGGPGVIDAWIDWNQDGDWSPDERILSGMVLPSGTHQLSVRVPAEAELGQTWARFRLSRDGVALPTGFAPDGEVEDYQIQIFANPYQNPSNPLDVNGDGFLSPIDALLVINALNNPGPGPLPLPRPTSGPPFLDVSGDGELSAIDALLVINELNRLSDPAGEGEGWRIEASGSGGADSSQVSLASDTAGENLTPLSAQPAVAASDLLGLPAEFNSVALPAREPLASPKSERELVPSTRLVEHLASDSAGPVRADIFSDPSVMDLEDLLGEIAADVDNVRSQADAHDELFANIHF